MSIHAGLGLQAASGATNFGVVIVASAAGERVAAVYAIEGERGSCLRDSSVCGTMAGMSITPSPGHAALA